MIRTKAGSVVESIIGKSTDEQRNIWIKCRLADMEGEREIFYGDLIGDAPGEVSQAVSAMLAARFTKHNIQAAVAWWETFTRGRYSLRLLRGPHAADARQSIMETLSGEKVTKSKAGINALTDMILMAAGIDPASDSPSSLEAKAIEWAKDVRAATEEPAEG